MILQLDEKSLHKACDWLAEHDPVLFQVLQRFGYPPLWDRLPSFATLVHIILEQQVSLASANAAFSKLRALLQHEVTPSAFLSIDETQLRQIGFSKQKIRYARSLADALLSGKLDLHLLGNCTDQEVRRSLTALPGIGNWTADIFLSECLLRPDIFPAGDIAMQEAFRRLYQLPQRPSPDEFIRQTLHWSPWRSAATRMLWHFYLCERSQKSVSLLTSPTNKG